MKIKICPIIDEITSCNSDCIVCDKFKLNKIDKNTNLGKIEVSSNELIWFIKNILKIKLSLWQVKLIKEFCQNK